MEELGAADNALGRSIHSIDVSGLIELDLIVTWVFILKGKFLPGLGHTGTFKRIKM
jgi:hypothetical protein